MPDPAFTRTPSGSGLPRGAAVADRDDTGYLDQEAAFFGDFVILPALMCLTWRWDGSNKEKT